MSFETSPEALFFLIPNPNIRVIGEPITRIDGIEILLVESYGNLQVDTSLWKSFYEHEEVELLGEGDFHRGVNKIAQEFLKASPDDLSPEAPRLLLPKPDQEIS